MDTYFSLKRKGIEVSDNDFSEFPVLSPARKIRRLDAELAPIVEDEVVVDSSPVTVPEKSGGLKIEELLENEERAIVLFNPVKNAPLVHSPSSFSISVDPNLVSGFKYQLPWSNQPSSWRVDGDEATADENTSGSSNGCMAVVPWVPSQLPSPPQAVPSSHLDNPYPMEAEDMEGVAMDVEESMNVEQGNVNGNAVGFSEGLHQWQQHCMVHQLPQNMSTPIVWYR